MYESWLADRNSVHKSWDSFFQNVNSGVAPGMAHQKPPVIPMQTIQVPMGYTAAPAAPVQTTPAVPSDLSENEITKMVDEHLSVQALIRGYQIRGHLYSNLDPLNITKPALQGSPEGIEMSADSKEVK